MGYTVVAGAGSGIFSAYRKLAPEKEYILMDLPEKIGLLKQEMGSSDCRAVFFPLDVTDPGAVKDVFASAAEYRVEELVYLAGINCLAEALDVTEALWDKVLDTNLKGCFFVMQEAAKNMIRHGTAGRMVNIVSQHAFVGNTERAAYCASKAAMVGLNRVLALEWAPFGIRVNSVAPTWILYPCNEALLMDPGFQRKNLRGIPLKRYCAPEDVACAVDFLLSGKSRMMTGQSILLDGGWTIR